MNPNNNQALPTDYLDQIASKPAPKLHFLTGKKSIIAIVLGILIAITLILMIIAGTVSSPKTNVQLAARLNSAKSTLDSSGGKIKSSNLRAANIELKTYLINTLRDYKPILAAKGINIDKLDSKYTSLESNTDLLARLDDARLNAIYDRTYAREMATLLEKTLIMMQDTYDQTTNNTTRSFLSDAYDNLAPIQEEFAIFNG